MLAGVYGGAGPKQRTRERQGSLRRRRRGSGSAEESGEGLSPEAMSRYAEVAREATADIVREATVNVVRQSTGVAMPVEGPEGHHGWEYVKTEKGVTIFRKSVADSPVHCIMGKSIIGLPPSVVFETLGDINARHAFDRTLVRVSVLDEVMRNDIESITVVHELHQSRQCMLTHARDVCIVLHQSRLSQGRYVTAARSVAHPSCPEDDRVVRSLVMSSGCMVQPVGETDSLVTYITQVDLRGSVPSALANFISLNLPLTVASMRSHLEYQARHAPNTIPAFAVGAHSDLETCADTEPNADAHPITPESLQQTFELDEPEPILESLACTLDVTINLDGVLYVTPARLCFVGTLFGTTRTRMIPFAEITGVRKKTTALVFGNGIEIDTPSGVFVFLGFTQRGRVLKLIRKAWRQGTGQDETDAPPRPTLAPEVGEGAGAGVGAVGGAPEAADSEAASAHIRETLEMFRGPLAEPSLVPARESYLDELVDVTFPHGLERVAYVLFATPGFLTDFLESTHFCELALDVWRPNRDDAGAAVGGVRCNRYRSMLDPSNIVGPKSTRVENTQTLVVADDGSCSLLRGESKMPDVPYGAYFVVTTRFELRAVGENETRVTILAGLTWRRSSLLRRIIERTAVKGMKQDFESWEDVARRHIDNLQVSLSSSASPPVPSSSSTPLSVSAASPSPVASVSDRGDTMTSGVVTQRDLFWLCVLFVFPWWWWWVRSFFSP